MEEILNQILEEQRKQTEILQSIGRSLKDGENIMSDYRPLFLEDIHESSVLGKACDSNPTIMELPQLQDDNKLVDKPWSYPSSTSDHTKALEKTRNSYTF